MKRNTNLNILILALTIVGFSLKVQGQELASQKPLSSFYTDKMQNRLGANKANKPHLFTPMQDYQNLPSVKPLPKLPTRSTMKNAGITRNTGLSENEKIKKLPSKSALTLNQIAARKPAAQKPQFH